MSETDLSQKVSIIVPVYNVEKYLAPCLDSLIHQTYRDLEIILIDDGSSDRSGMIAKEYAGKDPRIIFLSQANSGAGAARNAGLRIRSGGYVMFVDSDDWLEKNEIELLVNALHKSQADIAVCQYYDEFVSGSVKHSFLNSTEVCTPETFTRYMLKQWELLINCNKLYRSEVVEELEFPVGRCIDDEFYTYKAVLKSNRIVLLEDYLYHYRQRRSSAMGDPNKENQRMADQIAFVTERYPALTAAFPALKTEILEHMLVVFFTVLNHANSRELYRTVKRKLFSYGGEVLSGHTISKEMKRSYLSQLVHPMRRNAGAKAEAVNLSDYYD